MDYCRVLILIAVFACFEKSVSAESLAEEERRMKSLILNEGQRGQLTCPDGKVMRVKTAQYRLVGPKVCSGDVSTCRNNCPGSFVSNSLAKRCDLQQHCPVAARPASSRDSCSQDPEPLCILYTCNDAEQAKGLGNPSETYMEILQSQICGFARFARFCEY